MSYEHLTAAALPEGSITIQASDDEALAALVGGRQVSGDAVNPVWLMVALVGGLGIPIADVYAMVDCSMEDGPMLGECDLEFDRPLRAGTYRVLSEILDVRRASGRSGVFDLMRMRVRLADDAGVAATCTAVQVVPRRAA
jgi:hypothetical protein